MATQSAPPNLFNDSSTNQDTAVAQPVNEDQVEDRAGSVFVSSEPIREEQVQNAVKFLSHPKVSGSPVMYRRSFLEKKGLTKEEIDEAFRRVPDPSPTAQTSNLNNDVQRQASTQILQSVTPGLSGAVSSVDSTRWSRFQWTHVVYAVGILAITGAGSVYIVKNAIVPRLKSWVRKIVLEEADDKLVKKIVTKPNLAEETAAAAKAAAAAVTDVAKATQEMFDSKNEERRKFDELVNLLDAQVREMKVMTSTLQRLEGQNNGQGRTSTGYQEDHRPPLSNFMQQSVNGKTEYGTRPVRSSSPPMTAKPQSAPHSKSYMEIVAMVQRGEKPSNIRDINDLPPNPNQQPSNPRLAPITKPWEVGLTQQSSHPFLQTQGSGEALNPLVQDTWLRSNVGISEVENEDGPKSGPDSSARRMWVPPQAPPVAMAEAAEAIRRSKTSVQTEQANDELQRITKLSEFGGSIEGGIGLSSNQIRENSFEG